MTKFEENIYNTYLKAIAKGANRPYKLRKDFKDFEKDPKYHKIQRLASLFMNNDHINIDIFFNTPYELYKLEENKSYTLDFYISRKALGAYKTYIKMLELTDPDNEHNLKLIKDTIRFVHKYCTEHNLTYEEYIQYKVGLTPVWMTHYFDRKISIYFLLDYDKLSDTIYSIEPTHRKMVLGDLDEKYPILKTQYVRSNIASKLVKAGIVLVNKVKIREK